MSKKGREPDPKKISAIINMQPIVNAKGIAKVLRHVAWYRESIPDYATIALPIAQLFRKDVELEWNEKYQQTLNTFKVKLNTYPILRPLIGIFYSMSFVMLLR